MRFWALFGKEFRECLPWMIAAAVFLLVIGGAPMWIGQREGGLSYRLPYYSKDNMVGLYEFMRHPRLYFVGSILLISSVGLGLALGLRQFWIPHFTQTWGFLLHRSAARSTVLLAKLAVAVTGFVIVLGSVWIYFWWYGSRPEYSPIPPAGRSFVEGWIYIVLGFVGYLGIALAGISTARWYTTKIFGLALAGIALVVTLLQWRLSTAFAVICAALLLLMLQLFGKFLTREF